jgi:hypothetical protein
MNKAAYDTLGIQFNIFFGQTICAGQCNRSSPQKIAPEPPGSSVVYSFPQNRHFTGAMRLHLRASVDHTSYIF